MNNSKIRQILANYPADNEKTLSSLSRLLNSGKLGGSGKLLILPVDQGFEHGPDRSFHSNIEAYDPLYHFKLCKTAQISALAAPLGFLEAGAHYASEVPLILKVNNSNGLFPDQPDQALTSSVADAKRIGCVGIGITIYPGSSNSYDMMEQAREVIARAKECGLFTIVWAYPRGEKIKQACEDSLDLVSYSAHMACLLGAHIVKVKPPAARLHDDSSRDYYNYFDINNQSARLAHVVRCCFAGRRMVLFSGGKFRQTEDVISDARAIFAAGATGQIIGRSTFSRPFDEAVAMLNNIMQIYLS